MIMRKLFVTALVTIVATNCFSQTKNSFDGKFRTSDLKSKIANESTQQSFPDINKLITQSSKSPGLALLFSLVLPGAGHYYLNRMDVGKYFLAADAASWVGLASLNIYGDNVRDDSRKYSTEHAGVSNVGAKPESYFTNIGSYNNVYDYNNEKLNTGEYALLYDVNQYYWNWDSRDSRSIYEAQRKSSERIYNTRIIFGSLLIANRIISGISAFLIAKKSGTTNTSFNFEPELLYKKDYSLDGIRLNLSKNF